MSEFREYQVVANGIRQHAMEAGSHGVPELSHSWRHQARALADAAHAVDRVLRDFLRQAHVLQPS